MPNMSEGRSGVDNRVPLYRSPAVARLVGVSYRQLDHWVTEGHVRPVVGAAGSGTQRLLSPDDVARLARILQLRRLGVALRVAADPPAAIAALVDEGRVEGVVRALQHLPVTGYAGPGPDQLQLFVDARPRSFRRGGGV